MNALVSAVLAMLLHISLPPPVTAQVYPGAAAIYFPKSQRALLFGGAIHPTYFRTITAIDLSKPFSTHSPPFTTLPNVQLPVGTRDPIPWVSSSGTEIALFGGLVYNAGASTPASGSGIAASMRMVEAKVTGGGAGVEALSSQAFPHYNVTEMCFAQGIRVTHDAQAYVFGGYSYVSVNSGVDDLQVFDADRTLKNVTIASGSERPRRRMFGSLVRLDANRLLLTGGYLMTMSLDEAWVFTLSTGTWSQAAKLLGHHARHQSVVVKPSGSAKSYVVLIGGTTPSPLFEYSELPPGGATGFAWKRVMRLAGRPDIQYMVNHAAVVIGDDQIVIFGASVNASQADQIVPMVAVKVKEPSSGELTFESAETFTPQAADTSGTGGGTDGAGGNGNTDGGSLPTPTVVIVSVMSSVTVVVVVVFGLVWYRRRTKPKSEEKQTGASTIALIESPPSPTKQKEDVPSPPLQQQPSAGAIVIEPPPVPRSPRQRAMVSIRPASNNSNDALYLGSPPEAMSSKLAEEQGSGIDDQLYLGSPPVESTLVPLSPGLGGDDVDEQETLYLGSLSHART